MYFKQNENHSVRFSVPQTYMAIHIIYHLAEVNGKSIFVEEKPETLFNRHCSFLQPCLKI